MSVVAALQIGADPDGTAASLGGILAFEDEPRESGAALVVLPEAVLGGYPRGHLGAEAFTRYFEQTVTVPGPETEALAGLSARTGASLVAGVIERAGPVRRSAGRTTCRCRASPCHQRVPVRDRR